MESIASTSSTGTLPQRIPGASGHKAALRSGDRDPVIPRIPGPRQPSDRSDADRAAFAAASYVRPTFGTAA